MEVVYGRTRPQLDRGQVFRNARFFRKPVDGATKVLVHGDYPAISRAYSAVGVPVSRTDALRVDGPRRTLPPHERGAVVIPDNWRDLPWTQKSGESGATLRALASAISDAPVNTKAEAEAVVEGELERRA